LAHVTNFHVQREAPDYDPVSDTIGGLPVRASLDEFYTYVGTDLSASPSRFRYNLGIKTKPGTAETIEAVAFAVREKMKDCVRNAVASIHQRFLQTSQQIHQFALLGADILLDENGQAWILEFTKGPAFRQTPQYMSTLHNGLVEECVNIVLEVHKNRRIDKQWYDDGKLNLVSVKNFLQIWPHTSSSSSSSYSSSSFPISPSSYSSSSFSGEEEEE